MEQQCEAAKYLQELKDKTNEVKALAETLTHKISEEYDQTVPTSETIIEHSSIMQIYALKNEIGKLKELHIGIVQSIRFSRAWRQDGTTAALQSIFEIRMENILTITVELLIKLKPNNSSINIENISLTPLLVSTLTYMRGVQRAGGFSGSERETLRRRWTSLRQNYIIICAHAFKHQSFDCTPAIKDEIVNLVLQKTGLAAHYSPPFFLFSHVAHNYPVEAIKYLLNLKQKNGELALFDRIVADDLFEILTGQYEGKILAAKHLNAVVMAILECRPLTPNHKFDCNRYGNFLMIGAAKLCIADIISAIGEKATNLIPKDPEGNTPLHLIAERCNDKKPIEALITIYRSNEFRITDILTEQNKYGKTPLELYLHGLYLHGYPFRAGNIQSPEIARALVGENKDLLKIVYLHFGGSEKQSEKIFDKAESYDVAIGNLQQRLQNKNYRPKMFFDITKSASFKTLNFIGEGALPKQPNISKTNLLDATLPFGQHL